MFWIDRRFFSESIIVHHMLTRRKSDHFQQKYPFLHVNMANNNKNGCVC